LALNNNHVLVTFYVPRRQTYDLGTLDESAAPRDPMELFDAWFADALETEAGEAAAMVLSTVDATGRPDGRVVLIRATDQARLGFFTNYRSAKASQLLDSPWGAGTFYWPARQRQVRVRGSVEPMSAERSDEYFASRPRGSQLSAWASEQSTIIKDRTQLSSRMAAAEDDFRGRDVQRPPHWGGYWLACDQIEFWQGRTDRLHDRLRFNRQQNGWSMDRLSP